MFTHLHVHSFYSLQDGIQRASDIGTTVASRGMNAVALTDHGYMGGTMEFVKGCRKAGVKPIIGNETYLAFGDARERSKVEVGETMQASGHFLLLAKNEIGYRNLLKLTEYSYEEGYYIEPRVDFRMLEQHSEGLVATSTCMSSHMAKYWRQGMEKEGRYWLERTRDIFGKDNFFLEVQVNNFDQQYLYNKEWMIPFSKEYGIPLVLTADAHQANQDQWKLRGLVQCIGWGQKPHSTKYEIKDYNAWMYDEEFAAKLARSWDLPPECVTNTSYIADMVDGDYFEKVTKAPEVNFDGLSNEDASRLLYRKATAGLARRFKVESFQEVPKEYRDRLLYEFAFISESKYSSYFLTVDHIVQTARDLDIPVGPGRGSAGGSLLAWSLFITGYHMDPIKHGLLFERFLNPGRVFKKLDFSADLG